MRTEIYWVAGSWPGKLGLAARPRGGDWLADEVADWERQGVSSVTSLLTPDEEHDLALEDEAQAVGNRGIAFSSLPIPDRGVPPSQSELEKTVALLDCELNSGKNVLVHCRQGIGRTGLVAACLLVSSGRGTAEAIEMLSLARGIPVPETEQQRNWIEQYATSLALSK